MKSPRPITFEFIDNVPSQREEGKLYISIKYRTAIHNCFCGCGMKVVTPIRPTGWRLIYDGDAVSLDPSVGNWSFACRSHYIIRRNQALPANSMTTSQIEAGRRRDRAVKDAYFQEGDLPGAPATIADAIPIKKQGLLARFIGGNRE